MTVTFHPPWVSNSIQLDTSAQLSGQYAGSEMFSKEYYYKLKIDKYLSNIILPHMQHLLFEKPSNIASMSSHQFSCG